jgi:hypothetical protein
MSNITVKDRQEVATTNDLPFTRHLSNAGLNAVIAAQNKLGNINHGIYSEIPIVCKGRGCPYYSVCSIKDNEDIDLDQITGSRCPMEIAEMSSLYRAYTEEFDIHELNKNMSLHGLVKDLIDVDLQINRANKIIAQEAKFLEDILMFDKAGNEIETRAISKPIEYKERLVKRRNEILQLLNSTPKDKAGSKLTIVRDPSTYYAEVFEKYKNRDVIEVEVIENKE